jgi:hypothetical protein
MGGPAGSGGSDRSDERKVDTYADQLKKEQARKSKTKKDKFGYTVKKSIFERIGDNHPVIQTVKNVSDKMNLNRRMKFANKVGVNIQGLSTEQILSKDFKSQLDAKGYTKGLRNVGGNDGGGEDRDADKNKQTPPQVGIFPGEGGAGEENTTPLYGDEENLTAEEIALKNKRKGRKRTVLTSVSGDTSKATLGKKTLLGA